MMENINILNSPIVIPETYVQYPGKRPPSELFGGTWQALFDEEGVFFRTGGGEALPFGEGIQEDQMQRIVGVIRTGARKRDSIGDNTTGAFRTTAVGGTVNAYDSGVNTFTYEDRTFDSGNSPDARVSENTDGETRPLNRTIRVWERI